MCDLRRLRSLAALFAGTCLLLAPVLATDVLSAAADAHVAQVVASASASPAESAHDDCWDAEVEPHQRHEDLRFESQRGLHHHLHATFAWSGAGHVDPPARSVGIALPQLDVAVVADASFGRRELERSPRQSRAPPQA